MEPTDYISPRGVIQVVTDRSVAVRLRAAGWWPIEQLRKAAEHDRRAAAHLRVVTEARRTITERRERPTTDGAVPPTDGEPARGARTVKTAKAKPSNSPAERTTS